MAIGSDNGACGRCMGLSLVFDEGPGSPGMSDGSNNRLSARVDMHVLDDNPISTGTAYRNVTK